MNAHAFVFQYFFKILFGEMLGWEHLTVKIPGVIYRRT